MSDTVNLPNVGAAGYSTHGRDCTPLEVVAILSPCRVMVRDMNWRVVSGSAHDGSAKYAYFSNPSAVAEIAKKTKKGWVLGAAGGARVYFGGAVRYYDPHF
jgi:hypothetical protein